jgi:hypothetical protein
VRRLVLQMPGVERELDEALLAYEREQARIEYIMIYDA